MDPTDDGRRFNQQRKDNSSRNGINLKEPGVNIDQHSSSLSANNVGGWAKIVESVDALSDRPAFPGNRIFVRLVLVPSYIADDGEDDQ